MIYLELIRQRQFNQEHHSKTTSNLFSLLLLRTNFRSFSFEYEKYHCEDQLDKVNTLINYFREKLSEHGLKTEQLYRTSSELTSFLHQPVKSNEEQSLPTSYMNEGNSEEIISANPSATAVAMKLPRDFLQLNLNLPLTNEIIHSPCSDRNEFEYKKELSQDILDKYGGCSKNKQQSEKLGKKFRKHKKVKKIEVKMSIRIYLFIVTEFWYISCFSNGCFIRQCS